MGLLANVLLGPVIGPLKGLLWLAQVLNEQAERTLYDEDGLRVALMELEQRFEGGEIDEEAFEAEEQVLLERLKIARDRARGLGDQQFCRVENCNGVDTGSGAQRDGAVGGHDRAGR